VGRVLVEVILNVVSPKLMRTAVQGQPHAPPLPPLGDPGFSTISAFRSQRRRINTDVDVFSFRVIKNFIFWGRLFCETSGIVYDFHP